jgi:hypothetical protein
MSERPEFKEASTDFAWDGSLRDIYILDTNATDWTHLGSTLEASGLTLTHLVNGQSARWPPNLANYIADSDRNAGLLIVALSDDLSVNCHFFTPDQIEFDFDPRCVHRQANWDRLLDFVVHLGHWSAPLERDSRKRDSSPGKED